MAPRRNGRAVAVATIAAPVRCAIYTRKSTDEGLDRAFTSLDNQRERGEAFITSQGWTALPARYEDGGFSGGTMDRPAMKRLLADVDAGLVDTIAVYKLDRLSRSLVDFGRLHEFLEKRDVALVSVTESINTSTPHGRMMVNVLLSFAQYERELVGERTRDKIQAARRRGRWTGGMPPLGYDVAPEGGKLLVNRSEAALVRQIFELFAATPSLIETAAELNRRAWRMKSWTTRDGKLREGSTWDRVSLARLLKDPRYVGKQRLGDEVFPGEHDAIVPRALFERVQRMMHGNRRTGGASGRNRHGALLRGLLRCTACDRAMTHTPARAHGRLYRYYRCQAAQKEGAAACPSKPISANRIEAFVVDQIRRIGSDPELQQATFDQAVSQVKARRRGLKLEQQRLRTELGAAQADVQRLVETVSRVTGPAAEAVAAELNAAQERATAAERRLAEIKAEFATLDPQALDRDELARALEAFDPIWDVLLTPERERVLQLLIERVSYDGSAQELAISWRLSGFGELAAEVAP